MFLGTILTKPVSITRRIGICDGSSYLIALIDYQPYLKADAGRFRYFGMHSGGIAGIWCENIQYDII
jgi:hypothetical protein